MQFMKMPIPNDDDDDVDDHNCDVADVVEHDGVDEDDGNDDNFFPYRSAAYSPSPCFRRKRPPSRAQGARDYIEIILA